MNLNIYKVYRFKYSEIWFLPPKKKTHLVFLSRISLSMMFTPCFGKQVKSTNKLQWQNAVFFNVKACRRASTMS